MLLIVVRWRLCGAVVLSSAFDLSRNKTPSSNEAHAPNEVQECFGGPEVHEDLVCQRLSEDFATLDFFLPRCA